MPTPAPKPRSPLKLLIKVIGAFIMVLLLAIGVTMGVSWYRATQPPPWWQPVNPADPQVDQQARAVENGVTNELHRSRPAVNGAPAEPWTLTIKDAEANAWLAGRLREWLLNRNDSLVWPVGASQPQLSFDDGVVRLGFEVTEKDTKHVYWTTLAPQIDEKGALWLRLQSFAIGRFTIPIPAGAISQGSALLESKLPREMKDNPDTKNFIEALAGSRPLSDQPVMKLSDGRKVQVLQIAPRPGEVVVTCRTMPR